MPSVTIPRTAFFAVIAIVLIIIAAYAVYPAVEHPKTITMTSLIAVTNTVTSVSSVAVTQPQQTVTATQTSTTTTTLPAETSTTTSSVCCVTTTASTTASFSTTQTFTTTITSTVASTTSSTTSSTTVASSQLTVAPYWATSSNITAGQSAVLDVEIQNSGSPIMETVTPYVSGSPVLEAGMVTFSPSSTQLELQPGSSTLVFETIVASDAPTGTYTVVISLSTEISSPSVLSFHVASTISTSGTTLWLHQAYFNASSSSVAVSPISYTDPSSWTAEVMFYSTSYAGQQALWDTSSYGSDAPIQLYIYQNAMGFRACGNDERPLGSLTNGHYYLFAYTYNSSSTYNSWVIADITGSGGGIDTATMTITSSGSFTCATAGSTAVLSEGSSGALGYTYSPYTGYIFGAALFNTVHPLTVSSLRADAYYIATGQSQYDSVFLTNAQASSIRDWTTGYLLALTSVTFASVSFTY